MSRRIALRVATAAALVAAVVGVALGGSIAPAGAAGIITPPKVVVYTTDVYMQNGGFWGCVDGYAIPSAGAEIIGLAWNWGDGHGFYSDDFGYCHFYSHQGVYKVTVTATQVSYAAGRPYFTSGSGSTTVIAVPWAVLP